MLKGWCDVNIADFDIGNWLLYLWDPLCLLWLAFLAFLRWVRCPGYLLNRFWRSIWIIVNKVHLLRRLLKITTRIQSSSLFSPLVYIHHHLYRKLPKLLCTFNLPILLHICHFLLANLLKIKFTCNPIPLPLFLFIAHSMIRSLNPQIN